MADLYHFSTKEDSYASYFIKVSPLSRSSSIVNISWAMSEPSPVPIRTKPSVQGKGHPRHQQMPKAGLAPSTVG